MSVGTISAITQRCETLDSFMDRENQDTNREEDGTEESSSEIKVPWAIHKLNPLEIHTQVEQFFHSMRKNQLIVGTKTREDERLKSKWFLCSEREHPPALYTFQHS